MLPTKTTTVGRWLVAMETLKFPKLNGMEGQSIRSKNSKIRNEDVYKEWNKPVAPALGKTYKTEQKYQWNMML